MNRAERKEVDISSAVSAWQPVNHEPIVRVWRFTFKPISQATFGLCWIPDQPGIKRDFRDVCTRSEVVRTTKRDSSSKGAQQPRGRFTFRSKAKLVKAQSAVVFDIVGKCPALTHSVWNVSFFEQEPIAPVGRFDIDHIGESLWVLKTFPFGLRTPLETGFARQIAGKPFSNRNSI
jgi:hypothetical protein